MKNARAWRIGIVVLIILWMLAACASKGGDDDSGGAADDTGTADDTGGIDDTAADDDTQTADDDADDDAADDDADDSADDDAADDDTTEVFTPWVNPFAKIDAFRLFYKERVDRMNLSFNRFTLLNDVVPAQELGGTMVSRSGSDWEVILHPVDNNDVGFSAFTAYQAYKVFRTRALGLSLIRMFEGLVVTESVSGHPGLTCREWQPDFNLEIDGPSGTVSRWRDGAPVSPAESFPTELEQEIVSQFFADAHFLVRATPAEYYFTNEAVANTGTYAVTEVFAEWPRFLRVSDCCSSFMVSQEGTYQGYFWGNHNSRDNFPDYTWGYVAAMEIANDPLADADVKASAAKAAASGHRIGDSVVDNNYNLMTVGETGSYDDLIVAGSIRPDGTTESEDLGSMNSCQMSYMAKALSTDGLHSSNVRVAVPGSYLYILIKELFQLIGITPPDITFHCDHIDNAYGPLDWKDMVDPVFFGASLLDLVQVAMIVIPDTIVPLLDKLTDSLEQPYQSMAVIVYYAQVTGQPGLLQDARETLHHLLTLEKGLLEIMLAYGQANNDQGLINNAQSRLYKCAVFAHIYGVGDATYDPTEFTRGNSRNAYLESELTVPDSSLWALKGDDQLWQEISNAVNGANSTNVQNRYWARFPTEADKPIRALGDHYEAVGLDGDFHEIPNIMGQWFSGSNLWMELPLCTMEPTVLDCSWAALGCARPDLDGSGTVDAADTALFNEAWSTYGTDTPCDGSNSWCGGADLDHSGHLDNEDQNFMQAAQGCWY